MGMVSGSLNARGFSQSVSGGQLPDYNHITHSGAINQTYFSVGPKPKQLLNIHHGTAATISNLFSNDPHNYFISLFLKSSKDGEKRDRSLNIVIALDVSGSMGGRLSSKIQDNADQRTRLELSRKAISMLYEKLQPNDCFSLIIFHDQARTIVQSAFVKDLKKQTVFQLINSNFESGGTTISAGFKESLKNANKMKDFCTLQREYEHRIVMLTDVCDNSIEGQEQLIKDISNSGVFTTIIGVSSDFRSQTCEKLIKIKGFNYMCAVDDEDLQTYLVDQFDYTFFPAAQNISIAIQSPSIESIKVYGSVDQDITYPILNQLFTVTNMKSFFPSHIANNKSGNIQTRGGLILVKYVPKQKQGLPKLNLSILLKYENFKGNVFEQSFVIDQVIQSQVMYSDEAIKTGVSLYYYTQTIRNLLKAMKEGDKMLSDENKGFYLDQLNKLKDHCPKSKEEQLKKLHEIVEKK